MRPAKLPDLRRKGEVVSLPKNFIGVQCPKCPRKIGSLALYCPACGTRLRSNPALENPTEFNSRRREIDEEFLGPLCGRTHHYLMAMHHLPENVQSGISPRAFCPDCGLDITHLHPDFKDEQPS